MTRAHVVVGLGGNEKKDATIPGLGGSEKKKNVTTPVCNTTLAPSNTTLPKRLHIVDTKKKNASDLK